jgi:hypothetical protein
MFRIDDSSAAVALPTPEAAQAEGFFTEGNPSAGSPATLVRASWLNMVQEELRGIVTSAGLTPSKTNYGQVLQAIQMLLQQSSPSVCAAGGTADALTGTFVPAITLLTNGMRVYVRAASANATTTPTFTPAPGVIAAKTIVKGNNLALAPGDISGAGHWLELQYDQVLDKWLLLNPARGVIYGASLGTSGWTKLPSGLLVQWTTGVGSASGDVAASWPIAFPTALYSFSATAANGTGTTGTIAQVGAANTSSISVGTWQGSTPSRIVQAFYVMGVGS